MGSKTTGIVLSGGQGRRASGEDKGLLPWDNTTRIETLLSIFSPQVDELIISCNRNFDRYAPMAGTLVQDQLSGYQGPLAGISAALAETSTAIAVCVRCDCPNPPPKLVERLLDGLEQHQSELVFAHDGVRAQYLFCAMRTDCLASLNRYLSEGGRAVKGWHQRIKCAAVDFSDSPENFANHNRSQPELKAETKTRRKDGFLV